jgi:thioredoxin:protein disulfide reductase
MWNEHGPIGPLGAAVVSFGVGVIASLAPTIYATVPRTAAILARRAGRSTLFLLGVVTLFTPLGLMAGLAAKLLRTQLWSPFAVYGVLLLYAVLAASMLGAFAITVPASLATKLSAIGRADGKSVEEAWGRGLVLGILAAPATVPFAIGLSAAFLSSQDPWTAVAGLASFGVGLSALSFLCGTFHVRLPLAGAWNEGISWLAGIGLIAIGVLQVTPHYYEVEEIVRDPSYLLGVVGGGLALIGAALAAGHFLGARRGSTLAHFSLAAKLASIVPAAMGCALFASWAPHEHGNAPEVAWITDEESGVRMARAEHKPMVIVFNPRWCCRQVEHDMFFDPRVREEAERFIAIHIDATDDDAPDTARLQEKYKVVGLPTIVMFDANGRETVRINEITSGERLANEMKATR